MVLVGKPAPAAATSGAMSPEPVTVYRPAACAKPPALFPGESGPPPIFVPAQPPPCEPDRLRWSNTPVAWLGPAWPLLPPNELVATVEIGEVANSPTCTVAGSPVRVALPTWVQ